MDSGHNLLHSSRSLVCQAIREARCALIGLYVVFVALSQIVAAKVANYDLGFVTVTAPAAVLIYAVTYLFTDIVNERFGRREVHKMILIAFVTQLAMVFFLWLGTELPPAPFWKDQKA